MINQILENQYFLIYNIDDNYCFNCRIFCWIIWYWWRINNCSFLFFIFEYLNIDPNYLMHLAVGTSFSIIIPTSFVSVYTHNKHGCC